MIANNTPPLVTIEPDDYTFPTIIVLDAEAYADMVHAMRNPRKPTQALIDLFKR